MHGVHKTQRVVTYTSPVEAFATGIKNLDRWKIVLDRLIPREFKRTKRSHACQVSEKVRWSVDFSSSEFVLIPWSARKKDVDRLIPFWSRSQTLLQATSSDHPLGPGRSSSPAHTAYQVIAAELVSVAQQASSPSAKQALANELARSIELELASSLSDMTSWPE